MLARDIRRYNAHRAIAMDRARAAKAETFITAAERDAEVRKFVRQARIANRWARGRFGDID